MDRYCGNPGARFGARLKPFAARCQAIDLTLDNETRFHNLLRATADDPVMRETQDIFFEDVYWQPAARSAELAGVTTPLGVAVVYDSTVHGSWKAMRDLTTEQAGSLAAIGEAAWLGAYIKTRREWLANGRSDLRATVYRMDAFQRLIDQGYWGLELPLVVRDHEISTATLAATPKGCYDGPQPGTRPLGLESPLARGLDVRLLQLGLSELGADIKADGVFGQTCVKLVKEYQASNGLPATGQADIALIAKLAG
jgi:chitosanase